MNVSPMEEKQILDKVHPEGKIPRMNDIDGLISRLCPEGVPHEQMGEVGEFVRGSGLQKADLKTEGMPAIHYGQIHTHYGVWATETISFVDVEFASRLRQAKPGDVILATTSEDDDAVGKATAWLGDKNAAEIGRASCRERGQGAGAEETRRERR